MNNSRIIARNENYRGPRGCSCCSTVPPISFFVGDREKFSYNEVKPPTPRVPEWNYALVPTERISEKCANFRTTGSGGRWPKEATPIRETHGAANALMPGGRRV